jgi:hypothetical protein
MPTLKLLSEMKQSWSKIVAVLLPIVLQCELIVDGVA